MHRLPFHIHRQSPVRVAMLQRDTLETWLAQLGIEFQDAELPPEQAEDFRWALTHTGSHFRTYVAQRGVEENQVTIQIGIDVSEEHRAAVEDLDDGDRVRFLYDLRLKLIERPTFFYLDVADGEIELPTRLTTGRHLLDEEIQRGQYFDAQDVVQATGLTFVAMFKKMANLGEWN